MAERQKWTFEKKFGPAFIMLVLHLIVLLSGGITFYNTVNNNQTRNEERFKEYSELRKTQADQMSKFQDVQNQTLIQLASMTERLTSMTELFKDVRDNLLRTNPRRLQ